MKLKEFIDTLNEMVEANPKLLEFDVVYSSDSEGNYYDHVFYTPTVGNFTNDFENIFDESKKPNAICIN